MGAVAGEKDKGTAAMMLVKPITRGAFITAKFLALALVFALGIILAGLFCYYYTLLLYEAIDLLHWLVLNTFMLLYVLVIIAITLLCSTLTRSSVTAAGIAIGALVFIGLLGSIPDIWKISAWRADRLGYPADARGHQSLLDRFWS